MVVDASVSRLGSFIGNFEALQLLQLHPTNPTNPINPTNPANPAALPPLTLLPSPTPCVFLMQVWTARRIRTARMGCTATGEPVITTAVANDHGPHCHLVVVWPAVRRPGLSCHIRFHL